MTIMNILNQDDRDTFLHPTMSIPTGKSPTVRSSAEEEAHTRENRRTTQNLRLHPRPDQNLTLASIQVQCTHRGISQESVCR